jgi:Na+-transporting methylmalonyl-CoA/oxaloacetate decarboxylase gamma subunit
MSIESLEYALVTAAVGMGIVFFALLALSGVMLLIRAIFGGSERKTVAASIGTPVDPEAVDPDQRSGDGLPRWAIAGAVAYILAEDTFMTPHAAPWTNRIDEERG